MSKRDIYSGAVRKELQDLDLRDDFEFDDLDDEEITIYDVDTVLGYTVDVFKIGFPFLFLITFFIGLIYLFGMYVY